MQRACEKFPGTPQRLLCPRLYRDDSANSLTKCIVDYVRFRGGFASRINSTGIYRKDLKRFVYNTQRRGLPDIQAVINGQPLFIEVKIGRDQLSEAQEKIRDEVTSSGACFFVAKNFADFKTWFDLLDKKEAHLAERAVFD